MHLFRIGAIIILPALLHCAPLTAVDVTVAGHVKYRDGIARIPINLIKSIKDDLSVNFISVGEPDYTDIPDDIRRIIQAASHSPGKVAINFAILWSKWLPGKYHHASFLPDSAIKIAYSMIESSQIPQQWATLLNKKFDLVVVPDEYYVNVYQKSGVKIPIFTLPHGIDIEEFLEERNRKPLSHQFVFGSTGQLHERKNFELLIEAFHAEFGDNPNVKLMIHSRSSTHEQFNLDALKAKLNIRQKSIHLNKISYGKNALTPTIEINLSSLPGNEYKNFLNSLDCFVLLSKGEGFSLTPREALALGKPCIITDNTAHHTIAKTGFVYAIPSNKQEPAFYAHLGLSGHYYNCTIEDVRKALREVYTNFELYQKKAESSHEWLQQYTWPNLKAKFLNLLKPKKIILGAENKITSEYFMTNNKDLYGKYLQIAQPQSAKGT